MSRKSDKDLSLRIDFRNHRITIHKATLREIGNPAFIHLGVHPGTMNLVVLGTWVDERRAIRVRFTKAGTFYIHSKPLIEGIRSVAHFPEIKNSCLLKGKKIGSIPAISFILRDMVTEEGRGYHDEGTAENGSDIQETDGTIQQG